MLRVTTDILELRHWAESRGGRPCRDVRTGRIGLAFGADPCAFPVGWDELEPAFFYEHDVFVYDDAPGATRCFVGRADEAQAFVGCGA